MLNLKIKKNMRKKTLSQKTAALLLACSCLFPNSAFCAASNPGVSLPVDPVPTGNRIVYHYDNAGNRIVRQYEVIYFAKKHYNDVEEEQKMPEIYEAEVLEYKITIYPNPTDGILIVDISGGEINQQSRIFLYNLSGTILQQWNVSQGYNTIDISSQPSGSYLLKVMPDNQKENIWKIIKN
jgi:hypothetical protein